MANGKVTNLDIYTEIKYLRRDIDDANKRMEKNAARIGKVEDEQIRIKQTQSIWNYGLAVLSVAVSGIASFFGVRRS